MILPAFNEAPGIVAVVSEIKALCNANDDALIDDIIVCDNDSDDGTAALAQRAGARVVHESFRGYGAACFAGMQQLGKIDMVVFVDADHSVAVREIPELLQAIVDGADLAIGWRCADRREKDALSLPQKVGNILASRLITLIWQKRVSDLGPFRAVRQSSLNRMGMRDRSYGWTVEMQVKAIQLGMLTTEVPVSCLKRIGHSKISGTFKGVIGAALGIFGMIFKLWLKPDVSLPKNMAMDASSPVVKSSSADISIK